MNETITIATFMPHEAWTDGTRSVLAKAFHVKEIKERYMPIVDVELAFLALSSSVPKEFVDAMLTHYNEFDIPTLVWDYTGLLNMKDTNRMEELNENVQFVAPITRLEQEYILHFPCTSLNEDPIPPEEIIEEKGAVATSENIFALMGAKTYVPEQSDMLNIFGHLPYAFSKCVTSGTVMLFDESHPLTYPFESSYMIDTIDNSPALYKEFLLIQFEYAQRHCSPEAFITRLKGYME